MEWVANDAFPFSTPEHANPNSNSGTGIGGAATGGGGGGGEDEEMDDAVKAELDDERRDGRVKEEDARVKEEDGDLDVAEDEDRWL